MTLDILKQLIELNSKTSDTKDVNNCLKFILQIFKKFNLTETLISSNNTKSNFCLLETKENNPNLPFITLSAHIDTVYNAHESKVKESKNKIFGVGVNDMKSSIFVIYKILSNLEKINKLSNIKIALSPEEEIATPNFRKAIKEVAIKSDYVLVFESTLNTEPENPDLTRRSIVRSRRGIHIYKVLISSNGGHSGVIFDQSNRHNCIELSAELIIRLLKCSKSSLRTTMNIGTINGGKEFNIIAPNTEFTFEVRFSNESEHKRVNKEIRQIISDYSINRSYNISIIDINYFPAMEANKNNENFINLCKNIAKKLAISLEVEDRNGGGESSLFQIYNPKAQVLDGFGVRGNHEHTLREFTYKESIESTIKFTTEVIKSILSS